MTGVQPSYLQTLCDEAGEEFDPNLTKAETLKRIDELSEKTSRGMVAMRMEKLNGIPLPFPKDATTLSVSPRMPDRLAGPERRTR
jgi:hypothetical protein